MANKPLDKVMRHLRMVAAVHGYKGLSDRDLLDRFVRNNDDAAFTAMIDRYGPMLLGVCRRALGNLHDAEDVCQATLLVLARKAGSIRKGTSLANWLHGVACRSAAAYQRAEARRRRRESAVEPAPPKDAAAEVSWREIQSILDEELEHLPARYRAPLILCYLDGKTRDEAAQRLGLAPAALHGRLERGRNLLRERLTRRGLTLSAALFATALGESTLRAALPASFIISSTKAAMAVTAGLPAAEAAVSASVLTLTNEVIKAMFMTKLKMTATLALSACLLGAATFGGVTSMGIAQDVKKETETRPAKPAAQAEDDEAFIRRVSLDLRGKEPTPTEIHFFVTRKDAGRRQKVIDLMIKERQAMKADEEMQKWSDEMRRVLQAEDAERARARMAKDIASGEAYRSIGIRVDAKTASSVAIALSIAPLGRVDILLTAIDKDAGPIKRVLLENVLVLAADLPQPGSPSIGIVTVALKQKDILKLEMARQAGAIELVPRLATAMSSGVEQRNAVIDALNDKEIQIKDKKDLFYALAKQLGTGDPKVMVMKQQLVFDKLAIMTREKLNLEREIRLANAVLRVLQVRDKDEPSKELIDKLLDQQPKVMYARRDIELIEDNIREAKKSLPENSPSLTHYEAVLAKAKESLEKVRSELHPELTKAESSRAKGQRDRAVREAEEKLKVLNEQHEVVGKQTAELQATTENMSKQSVELEILSEEIRQGDIVLNELRRRKALMEVERFNDARTGGGPGNQPKDSIKKISERIEPKSGDATDFAGQLVPTNRATLYAPVDGIVIQIAPGLKSGARVFKDQELLRIHDQILAEKIRQLQSEIAAAENVVRRASQADPNKGNDPDALKEVAEAKVTMTFKSLLLENLRKQNNALPKPGEIAIKSPMNGIVLSANFREQLLNKHVKPSEGLLRVGSVDPANPKASEWEIEVKIPQKHYGQVFRAFQEKPPGDELEVDLLLSTAPTRVFKGKLPKSKLANHANAYRDANDEAVPAALAWIRISGPDIPEASRISADLLLVGTEVRVRIRTQPSQKKAERSSSSKFP